MEIRVPTDTRSINGGLSEVGVPKSNQEDLMEEMEP